MGVSSKQDRRPARRSPRTVALCTALLDAEPMLPGFLASVREVVDEICVVDLGSRDRSPEIARDFGARVERLDWPDSTAEVRNAALGMARSDWILVLDPWERLHASTARELRNLAGSDRLSAALLNFVHHEELGRPHSWRLRLFRNDPARRYVGPRAEQLDPELETEVREQGTRVLMAHVRVDDHGREGCGWRSLAAAGGREAFEAALAKTPDDAYLWFRYGVFSREQGDAVEQEVAFRRAVELLENRGIATPLSFWTEAFSLWAAARRKHDLGGAKALLDRAKGLPHTAHYHFVSGEVALGMNSFDTAIASFEACRGTKGPDLLQEPAPGVMTWRASLGIAEAHVGRGEVDRAVAFLAAEAERYPDFEALPLARARIFQEQGRPEEAIASCTFALRHHSRSYALWKLCAELLLHAGNVEQARTAAQHAYVCSTAETRAEAEALQARCGSNRVA